MCPDSSPPNLTPPPKKRKPLRRFTPDEDALLLEHCHSTQGVTRIAKALGRNRSSVQRRANALVLSSKPDLDHPNAPVACDPKKGQSPGLQEVAPAASEPTETPDAEQQQPFTPYRRFTPQQIAHLVWLRAAGAPASQLSQAIERFGRTEKELRHLFLHLGLSYRYVPYFAEVQWKRLEDAFKQGGLDAVYKAFPRRAIGELRARLVSLGLIPGRSIGWRQSEISYLQHSMKIMFLCCGRIPGASGA